MAYPQTASEAAAAIPGATFTHAWLCDEAAGNLTPLFGGLTLTASSTVDIVYGDAGPRGGTDRAIGFTGARQGRFDGGAMFDVTGTDDLVVAWVGRWSALPAFGTMFGKATAAFANGWAVTGRDGTEFRLGLRSGIAQDVAIAGTSAFHVGRWHVGIAAIDRSTGQAGVGTRSLSSDATAIQTATVGASSFANASNFFVGRTDWVPANDMFRLAALYIGEGTGAATGVVSSLASALASFAAKIRALDATEQELFNFGRGALPAWMMPTDDEFLRASARVMAGPRSIAAYLFRQALITTAEGPTATTPDWIAQHARDRGTTRQAGESDAALQARLRMFPDAITRKALLDVVNAILSAAGVMGTAAMLELPCDAAYLGDYVAMTGTGGAFAQVGTTSKFTPTVLPWPTPPFRAASIAPVIQHQLVITGAASAGNNGTRTITGLEGNAALVTNAAGVAGADPTVTWKVQRLDVTGNLTDGFARAYVGRGYRTARQRPGRVIVILPFGTDQGTQNSITEALRVKKAGGVAVTVERRLNP